MQSALSRINDMLEAALSANTEDMLRGAIVDVMDEVRAMDAEAPTAAPVPTGADPVAASVEQLLTMLAETNTRTGAILSLLKKAGLLDEVSTGIATPIKLIKGGVKKAVAKRNIKKAASRKSPVRPVARSRRRR